MNIIPYHWSWRPSHPASTDLGRRARSRVRLVDPRTEADVARRGVPELVRQGRLQAPVARSPASAAGRSHHAPAAETMIPPRCVNHAFTSLARYTSAGGSCPVACATSRSSRRARDTAARETRTRVRRPGRSNTERPGHRQSPPGAQRA